MRLVFGCFVGLLLIVSCGEISEKGKVVVHNIDAPAGPKSSLPNLFSNAEHTLMSWVEKVDDSTTQLKYARLINGKWKEPQLIEQGRDWFVNWADFPAITENNGHLISHVLKKSSKETFSYDIRLNVLKQGDSHWTTDLQLHSDATKTEHGFVTTLPYKDDSFFIIWLDGRNTAGSDHDHQSGAMTIRAAEVSSKGTVSNELLLDERTCDCCQTTAAITANGPVVIYRDRSEEEVRDISIVRLVNGEWTTPKTIYNDNWQINGCPVNGPKSADIDNNLVVAWFTEAGQEAKVKVVFSSDGGASFEEPLPIGDSNVIGSVDIALIDSDNAIVSWMETIGIEAQIKAVKVHKSGIIGVPVIISRLDASRKTGFPQMELVGEKVYFAWTDLADDITTIKTAYVRLDRF
ncbi:MAG: hypothetical protein GY931_06240 [Maribacter sp.]|nr:hypothetical protein [Maribacter sp.]